MARKDEEPLAGTVNILGLFVKILKRWIAIAKHGDSGTDPADGGRNAEPVVEHENEILR